MTSVEFSLATREDDAGIRRLLGSSAMPGRIRVRFEREPDYFAGCAAAGPFTQVLVAKDGDKVVGVACRSVRPLYVNGIAEDVGYLGQLRVDPAYQGQLLVARGYAKMRELHEDGRARGCITTIVDGNDVAEGVLVRRPRSSMPMYRFLVTFHTLAIASNGGRRANLVTRSSSATDSATTFAALGPARNFFPAYAPQGEIVAVDGGIAALNDQRSYKQTVIDGYDTATRLVRPFYNLFARIKLPPPGAVLNHASVTHFCVAGDDPRLARELIDALLAAAAARGLDHILLGFTSRDPLLEVARAYKPVEYLSSIYTVSWDPEDDLHDRLDSRPRTLDISAL